MRAIEFGKRCFLGQHLEELFMKADFGMRNEPNDLSKTALPGAMGMHCQDSQGGC
jgi:hypothetical protein